MKRRTFLTGCAMVLTPRVVQAQMPGPIHRVGFLAARPLQRDVVSNLPAALRELGYIENRNLVLEWRWGDGRLEIVPALLAELIDAKVAVIAVLGNDAIAVAKRATTIPIVMLGASHPVEMGFIESFPRPGGHVTGFAYNPVEVAGKLVEILKGGVSANVPSRRHLRDAPRRRRSLSGGHGKRCRRVVHRERHGGECGAATNSGVVARTRLPAIYTTRQWIDVGGLMYYGPNPTELWRRVAYYIDRILKGTKPADLPVEQSARLDLVINLKTARTLGLAIPPSLLLRADQVIE